MPEYFGSETPKLGFGLMRLPRKGLGTDIGQFEKMVDLFLESGFTYFDTAFVYGSSEKDTKRALVDRHPRDSYTLATKLNAGIPGVSEKAAKKQFYTSLDRTGAGYFDYYLLHALQSSNKAKYDRYGLWDFVLERRAEGLIRHVGFSYHDGPELLDQLLTEHPEVEFVQLQINYADWENPNVTARANWETVRKHGKSVVIMEPVKGGKLANPPAEVKKLFQDYAPDASPASWAIRFAASLDGVITVLSGMSTLEQMKDNVSFMRRFQPLDTGEQKIVQEAMGIMGHAAGIPCTACRYCTDGCPKGINIPGIFAAANLQLVSGQHEEAVAAFREAASPGHMASDCIRCRRCEQVCPQHLPVVEHLASCAEMLEG